MVGGLVFAHLRASNPSWLSISSLHIPLPPTSVLMLLLGTHKWAWYRPMGLAFGTDQVVEDNFTLACLAKFQTPTVFDRDFEIYCSTFYKSHKIVKIITYILYIHENVSYNLIQNILN